MPRIAGVDIPDRKKILFSLQYVHGIGPKVAADILSRTGIDPDRRANELTDDEVTNIASLIDDELVVEGALRRQVAQSIQRLRDILNPSVAMLIIRGLVQRISVGKFLGET